MSKTNGRRSAQGNRPRPGFELQPVPDDEVVAGQSEKDLGRQWGAQGKEGPRTTRRGAQIQNIPGGLETAQDELESHSQSLDQPDTGGDRLKEPRLDQTDAVGDRRASLDQSSQEESDRLSQSLDQARGANDRLDTGLEYASDEGNTERVPRSEGSRVDREEETSGQGTNEEIETPRGSPPLPHGWRRVTRKAKSRDERSEGSKDVEDLLESSGSDDGSRYFKKWFDETKDGNEPESDDDEPDSSRRSIRPETRKRKRIEKKRKKAQHKVKEPPAFPRGFGDQLSSISRFGRDDNRKAKAVPQTPIMLKPDERNVPSGVHFNRAEGNKKKRTRRSRSRHSHQNKSGDRRTTKETDSPESDKSSSSSSMGSTPQPPVKRARRRRSPSTSPSSPSSSSSSSTSSTQDDTSLSSSTSSDESTSSSSSSSSSSESSDDRRKKKKKRKAANKKRQSKKKREEERALKRIKIDPPSTYNGKPDLDVFDRWALEVKTWVRLTRLSEEIAITLLNKYVTGKASTYYMKFVAGKEKEWSITLIFEGLFGYCFPKNFKSDLRRKLMSATQGKSEIIDYYKDIEIMADRFPDVNERGKIEIFWWGMHQAIRAEIIKMGAHQERSTLEEIAKCAVLAEESLNASGMQLNRDTRGWGRFANRTDGPKPYRPSNGEGSSGRNTGRERVRANAVTPQPEGGPSKPNNRSRDNGRKRFGRKVSRAKRDELRAEGKCFQCERVGHSQRDCPDLNTMRPTTLSAGNVNIARLERLSGARDRADLQVGSIVLDAGDGDDRETTAAMRRAYDLCAEAWGVDVRWLDVETRADSRYRICQYDTGSGELVEVIDSNQPVLGVMEVDISRFDNLNFRLTDLFGTVANTGRPCVREGGFRDRQNYELWRWSAIKWLRKLIDGQLELEGSTDIFIVQPSMKGYSMHIEGTDIYHEITHAEVLGDSFNIARILGVMRETGSMDVTARSRLFVDTTLNKRQSVMLHATRLMATSIKRKRATKMEGATSIEKTSMRVKDQSRKVPEPVVVIATLNGHQVRVLIDTGSMADFISTTVVEQLKLRKEVYTKPLSVQLAVHGSRSKVNCGTTVRFKYQSIDCERRFDIVNLDNYDVILGTPFLYQHKVAIGLNPPCVVIGSNKPVEMNGPDVITITSAAADLLDNGLENLRKQLRKEANDLCPDTSKTALPPMRAVNHTIPLIEPNKVYRFRPSRCPEAFRDQWRAKKSAYLDTGRWRTATGHNAIPLLMIPKISLTGDKPGIRTVFDKREQNANTYKLASPLPDIEEILREVSKHRFRSLIDGKDAYEQIRVIPEHVNRTLFTTPDGTMESLVMQQGDCNAGATYQTLMNHIFASYIGVFMYVYLDDIIIFSDSVKEHVEHVRTIFDVLRRERLFLGPNKMQFFAEELKILGHIIDGKGIRMDPHKVDKVINWKTPTNKDLLRSFIGAVGFLAPDCKGIRIPMGHLSSLTAESRLWRWDATAQRSFDDVKRIVEEHRHDHRKALDYSEGADPIYVTTDGCLTGGGGYVSQGKDPKTANVVAFWSGKWNSAQQNYPVHELELLALVETLKRFRGVLHGTKFTVRTDHRALVHFLNQKTLSARQHRWLDVLNEFEFEIQYIPGETNGFADALSRIYSNEAPGVVRAQSEYVDDVDELKNYQSIRVQPVYVETYLLSLMNAITRRSTRLASKPTPQYKETKARKPKPDSVGVDKGGVKTSEMERTESNEPKVTNKRVVPCEAGNPLFKVSSDLGISFPECIRGRYEEDLFFKPILDNPGEFTNFVVKERLVHFISEGVEVLAVPDVKEKGQGIRELLIRQGHSVLAHLGAEKTTTYLREQVWWKSMVSDVEKYCRSCHTCAVSKPVSGRPQGKLKTMPVPTRPWQYIGIDFVGPLPESSNRAGSYDMICVVIDLLTSMVHVIPSKQTYRASDIAELLFDSIYKLHGLPERIISDRDSLFTSHFWRRLHRLLNTELRMSSAFHPQTDGATERANRTITQMIRQCVSPDQKDWVMKLPAVEFAINSARSSTTGFSPFQLNYGRNPSPMVWRGEDEFPGVRLFADRMKMAIMSAHDAIIASRVGNTVQANKKRAVASYKEGDLVYLSTKNISLPKGMARKLAPKYLGPFAITKVLKEGATYQLGLSEELLKRGINPSFHASLLKPHVPNDDRRFPGRLPSQVPGFGKKPDEWVVDSIVDHQGRGVNGEFLIRWKAGDQTWAPYREVAHLMAMERYCELMGVEDPRDLPTKRRTEQGVDSVSLSGVRILVKGYKGSSQEMGSLSPFLLMAHSQSRESLMACAAYAQQWRDHPIGVGDPPTGPPPPGFDDYMRLVSGGRVASQPYNLPAPAPPPSVPPTTSSAVVSMPPEAFNHLVTSHVHLSEIAAGRRSAVPQQSTTEPPRGPGPRPSYHRGRGSYRGVRNRGTRGRPIPGGLGNNRRSRPSNNQSVRFPSSAAVGLPGVGAWGILNEASDPETASEAGSGITFGSTSLESLFRNNVVVSGGGVGNPPLGGAGLADGLVGQWAGVQDAEMRDVGPVASGSGITAAERVEVVTVGGLAEVADEPVETEGLGTPENPAD